MRKTLLLIATVCAVAMLSLGACSTPPDYSKLEQAQANAQATVDIVCAGVTSAAPGAGVVGVGAAAAQATTAACALAQSTAAALTAAVQAQAAAQAKLPAGAAPASVPRTP